MSQRDCWGWWSNEAKANDANEADRPMIPQGQRVIEADMANEVDETDTAEVDQANDAGAFKASVANKAHVTDEVVNTDEAEANEANEAEADEAGEADVDNNNAEMRSRLPRQNKYHQL